MTNVDKRVVKNMVDGAMDLALVHGVFGRKSVVHGMLDLMAEWCKDQIEKSAEGGFWTSEEEQDLEAVNAGINSLIAGDPAIKKSTCNIN